MVRHAMLPFLLILLFSTMTIDAQNARDGVEMEPLPDGLMIQNNQIILGVSLGSIGALLLGVLVMIIVFGRTKLVLILLCMQLIGVIVAGICTWVVTYNAARDTIEENTNNLLVFAGLSASSATISDLGAGVLIGDMLFEMVQGGMVDLTAGYPHVPSALLAAEQTVGSSAGTIKSVYMGTELGQIIGVNRPTEYPTDMTSLELWLGVGPTVCDDLNGYGTPGSSCRNTHELRCADVDGKRQCCAWSGNVCGYCMWQDMSLVDRPDICPPCQGPNCPVFLKPTFESFKQTRDQNSWDSPPTSTKIPGLCTVSTGASWESAPGVVTQTGIMKNGTLSGRSFVGSAANASGGGCSSTYDPRARPWYARADKGVWSSVYIFFQTPGEPITLGITYAIAVRNPNYNGVPYGGFSPSFQYGVTANLDENPWSAVLAIDYTFPSISLFVRDLTPTKNSAILIVAMDYILVAGSLPLDELSLERTLPTGVKEYTPINVTRPTGWKREDLYDVFPRIVRKYGHIRNARRAILQGGDAIVLSQPLAIKGDLDLLMAINMPYADVTEESEEATTIALILAVVISLTSGLLVSLMVFFLLMPLTDLSDQMSQVAGMHLDNLTPLKPGVTAEVQQMVADFGTMVQSLRTFREYMPQTALQLDAEVEEEIAEEGESKSAVSLGDDKSGPSGLRSQYSFHSSREGTQASTKMTGMKRRVGNQAGHLDVGLKQKAVTVMFMNYREFNVHITADVEAVTAHHALFINELLSGLKAHKGIPETFSGDRMIAHWNALAPCTGHQVKACSAANAITSKSDNAVIGIASGKNALCGNIGVDGMKRFSILASVVSVAHLLNLYCKRPRAFCTEASTIVDVTVLREAEKLFYFRPCNRLQYKKRWVNLATVVIFQLCAAKEQQEEEWMYQLEHADKINPHRKFANAFDAFLVDGTMPSTVTEAELEVFRNLNTEIPPGTHSTWVDRTPATELL